MHKLLMARETFIPNLVFLRILELEARTGQTDGQTSKTHIATYSKDRTYSEETVT